MKQAMVPEASVVRNSEVVFLQLRSSLLGGVVAFGQHAGLTCTGGELTAVLIAGEGEMAREALLVFGRDGGLEGVELQA